MPRSYPPENHGAFALPCPQQPQPFACKRAPEACGACSRPWELLTTSWPPVAPRALRSPALSPAFFGSSWGRGWGGHGRELASRCKLLLFGKNWSDPQLFPIVLLTSLEEFLKMWLNPSCPPVGGHLSVLSCQRGDSPRLGGLVSFWNPVHCVPL